MDKQIHITAEIYGENTDIDWLQYDETLFRFDLTKDASKVMVDMFLYKLISYNDIAIMDKQEMIQELILQMKNKEFIAPGGIHFQEGHTHIYNGCCCGVEMWGEIVRDLQEYESPWMGHDPDVSFIERDGISYISDNILPDTETIHIITNRNITVITYENTLFQMLIANIQVEYEEFVQLPLKKRIAELFSEEIAIEFVHAFDICFGKNRDYEI